MVIKRKIWGGKGYVTETFAIMGLGEEWTSRRRAAIHDEINAQNFPEFYGNSIHCQIIQMTTTTCKHVYTLLASTPQAGAYAELRSAQDRLNADLDAERSPIKRLGLDCYSLDAVSKIAEREQAASVNP